MIRRTRKLLVASIGLATVGLSDFACQRDIVGNLMFSESEAGPDSAKPKSSGSDDTAFADTGAEDAKADSAVNETDAAIDDAGSDSSEQ